MNEENFCFKELSNNEYLGVNGGVITPLTQESPYEDYKQELISWVVGGAIAGSGGGVAGAALGLLGGYIGVVGSNIQINSNPKPSTGGSFIPGYSSCPPFTGGIS